MTIVVRVALAAGVVLLAAGCSDVSGDAGGGSAAEPAVRTGAQDAGTARNEAAPPGKAGDVAGAEPAAAKPDIGREMIQTASLTVRTGEVAAARTQARSVVQRVGGSVETEHTSTTGPGDRPTSVLTLRVPADRFAEVLDRLADLGRVPQRQTSSDDVTMQVIDVEARVASAERALVRLRELLDRAESLSDVVTLENELLRRESELESLKSQQAYLEDQTALSTITLTLRPPVRHQSPEEAPAGFVGGLGSGWDALVGVLTHVVTAVGVLLPFALLLAVVLGPAWLVLRRTRLQKRSAG